MSAIASYPSIYNLGHRETVGIFDHPVQIEEKIDGSQFSFGMSTDGVLSMRSKGKEIIPDAPEKMFALAVDVVHALADRLTPGLWYRGEYLQKPKHNTLAYGRVPQQHIILFDIGYPGESFLSADERQVEADRLGFECVPVYHVSGHTVQDLDTLKAFASRISCLGGTEAEGVVIKAYGRYGADKKTLMAKYVREEFKEIHKGEWRKSNPTRSDIIHELIASYRTPARWLKAVQHMREAGTLQEAPQDIGPLMKEVGVDVLKECEAEIKEALWKYAWPQIQRGITGGLPQWYKDRLANVVFDANASTESVT